MLLMNFNPILPHTFLILLGLSSFISQCQNPTKLNFIYDCEDHICIEHLNLDSSLVTDVDSDNKIYKVGLEFIYAYRYIENGTAYFIGNNGHSKVAKDKIDNQTITELSFYCSPEQARIMKRFVPDYKQSGVAYEYYNSQGESLDPISGSGLIENEMNIWIHPFRRSTYFAQLNISAYPYVQLPIQVGNQYQWDLKVGGSIYTDSLWAVWDGATHRKHQYEVESLLKKDYSFEKEVEVYHIKANSSSEIGDTYAEFWFSEKYGFVEMLYTNLKGSQFHFQLDRIVQR